MKIFPADLRKLGRRFTLIFVAITIITVILIHSTEPFLINTMETENDISYIIGPAVDGGYYLLGMKQLHGQLFANKSWSTEQVFSDTISDIEALRLSYKILPVLNDIDDETDLNKIDLSFL